MSSLRWPTRSLVVCVCTLVLLFLPAPPCHSKASADEQAAVTRNLDGTVLDPSSSAIPGAEVTLFSAVGKLIGTTKTDPAGLFHFEKIPPGKYRIQVQAGGFKETRLDLSIGTKSVQALRITLAIASRSEVISVQVEDSAPQISSDTSENQNANNIDRDALDRVPVFDQDYITTLSRFLDDNTIGTNGVSLVVNGIEANGPGVSPSAIQEVKINQNPYSGPAAPASRSSPRAARPRSTALSISCFAIRSSMPATLLPPPSLPKIAGSMKAL